MSRFTNIIYHFGFTYLQQIIEMRLQSLPVFIVFCLLNFFLYLLPHLLALHRIVYKLLFFFFLTKASHFKVRYFMSFFLIVSLTFCVWLTYKQFSLIHARRHAANQLNEYQMQIVTTIFFFSISIIHWSLYELLHKRGVHF